MLQNTKYKKKYKNIFKIMNQNDGVGGEGRKGCFFGVAVSVNIKPQSFFLS
jgi:hypothetical protein